MSNRIPWPRIFAEGAVIVFSILLALAADAAWESRQERQAERLYYELLDRDLATTISQLESFIAFESRSAASALRAYDALSGGPPLPPEELSVELSMAGDRRTLTLNQPAYIDLTSTGNLTLLRNRELRDQIIQFYETSARRYGVIQRNTEQWVDRIVVDALIGPGLIRGSNERVEVSFDSRGYREPDDRIWSLDLDSPEVARVRSALWIRGISSIEGPARRAAEQARELQAAIRAELDTGS